MKSRLECMCWARLPRAGLGHKLFVWARGYVFATLNQLPFYATGFNRVRIGPLLRGEIGRYYFGQFSGTDAVALRQRLHAKLFLPRIYDPPVSPIADDVPKLYVFSRVPHWKDFFGDVRNHRDTVRAELPNIISQRAKETLATLPTPLISLHVRHGDFRTLKEGENFGHVGAVRTPLEYFKNTVNTIRMIAKKELPVTIFSDAVEDALAPLLALPNVRRHPPHSAIVDLLLMARSRIIVPSAGSTFGYWAGFLSDAAIMLHPEHIHSAIRSDQVNRTLFEGPTPSSVATCPELLKRTIETIGSEGC